MKRRLWQLFLLLMSSTNGQQMQGIKFFEFFKLTCKKGLIRSDIPRMLNVKAPPGMASLAFVFDTTGSMWDDLEKVKRGAQRILMSAIKRKVQPLFNYILGIL